MTSGCLENTQDDQADILSFSESDNLLGYWQFEEKHIWNDSSGEVIDTSSFNQHGQANGTRQLSPGKIGAQYASFDGIDDYILIPDGINLRPAHITVEAWVKASYSGDIRYILSKGSSCLYSSYGLYTDANGGISFYIADSTAHTTKSPNPGSSVWYGQWHHVAGTFDGSYVRLYIDGVEIDHGTPANTTIMYNMTDGNDLIIGSYNGSCLQPFNGSIDDVLLWDTALSAEIIYEHYLLGITPSNHTSFEPTIVSLGTAREQLRTSLEPYTQNDMIAIQGSLVNVQDRLLISIVRSQVKNVDNIATISDTNITQASIQEYSVLVLLGGEKTNEYTTEILSTHDFDILSYSYASPFMLLLGHDNTTDKDIVIIYTAAEQYNLINKAAERSPLSGIIDKRYVPIAATATSIVVLYLWNIFGNTVFEFIFDFTSEKAQDREMKKRRKRQKHLFQQGNDTNVLLKQLLGIILSVLVFSIAMSWTWSEQLSDFLTLFIINIIVISIIYSIKELLRSYFSKKKKMCTEHVFWPFGAALTLGSTILGNTFSTASYTYLDSEEALRQYGRMYFFIYLALYVFSLVAFILNFLFPSVIFQMMFVFAIMSIFIDMTPIDPMNGYDVKSWNFNRWLLLYILIACSYLIMNFTLFI